MERNKRLALALEIKNPDLSGKLGNPTYSQFLKDYALQNPKLVAQVEKALTELVKSAQQVSLSHELSCHLLCLHIDGEICRNIFCVLFMSAHF